VFEPGEPGNGAPAGASQKLTCDELQKPDEMVVSSGTRRGLYPLDAIAVLRDRQADRRYGAVNL